MRRRGRRVSLPPLSRRLYHRTLDSRVYVTGEPVRYNVGRHFNRWPLLFFTSNFPFVVPRNSRHVASRHYSHGKSGTATQINDRRFKGKLIRTSRVPRKPRHRLSFSLTASSPLAFPGRKIFREASAKYDTADTPDFFRNAHGSVIRQRTIIPTRRKERGEKRRRDFPTRCLIVTEQ